MPAIGEICSYRSQFSGGVFDATVKVIYPDGRVDIDVWLPDGKLALTRHKVAYSEDRNYNPKGTAFPKSHAAGE